MQQELNFTPTAYENHNGAGGRMPLIHLAQRQFLEKERQREQEQAVQPQYAEDEEDYEESESASDATPYQGSSKRPLSTITEITERTEFSPYSPGTRHLGAPQAFSPSSVATSYGEVISM